MFIQDYTLEKLHSNHGALLWLVEVKNGMYSGGWFVVTK